MTFVSIKYTARALASLDPFEIRVEANGGHRRHNLGEASPLGMRERSREDSAMFGLRAATMRAGALLERSDDFLIDAAHQ
jgi:hypothetical protein